MGFPFLLKNFDYSAQQENIRLWDRSCAPLKDGYRNLPFGGRARQKEKVHLLMKKMLGVATNVYLRENVRKSKKRYAKYENKGLGIVYAQGRY